MIQTLFIGGIGMQEVLLIALVVLLFFGGKKIPELMKGLGKGVRSFKDGMNEVEKDIKDTYTPRMKKLTYSQGKLLIKLVDRECNQSSYEIVKAFFGPAKAAFYQVFAWTFRASLKKEYDPEDDDKLIERVVRQVETGQL